MPGRRICVVAHAIIRGLHANLVDLGALMAAGKCDVMVCAETLVSETPSRAASYGVLILWCDECGQHAYC